MPLQLAPLAAPRHLHFIERQVRCCHLDAGPDLQEHRASHPIHSERPQALINPTLPFLGRLGFLACQGEEVYPLPPVLCHLSSARISVSDKTLVSFIGNMMNTYRVEKHETFIHDLQRVSHRLVVVLELFEDVGCSLLWQLN